MAEGKLRVALIGCGLISLYHLRAWARAGVEVVAVCDLDREKAEKRAAEFGMQVLMVAAIVDRCEGGREAFAARGIRFQSLLSIADFGIAPPTT